jgi:hypothetical protein
VIEISILVSLHHCHVIVITTFTWRWQWQRSTGKIWYFIIVITHLVLFLATWTQTGFFLGVHVAIPANFEPAKQN